MLDRSSWAGANTRQRVAGIASAQHGPGLTSGRAGTQRPGGAGTIESYGARWDLGGTEERLRRELPQGSLRQIGISGFREHQVGGSLECRGAVC